MRGCRGSSQKATSCLDNLCVIAAASMRGSEVANLFVQGTTWNEAEINVKSSNLGQQSLAKGMESHLYGLSGRGGFVDYDFLDMIPEEFDNIVEVRNINSELNSGMPVANSAVCEIIGELMRSLQANRENDIDNMKYVVLPSLSKYLKKIISIIDHLFDKIDSDGLENLVQGMINAMSEKKMCRFLIPDKYGNGQIYINELVQWKDGMISGMPSSWKKLVESARELLNQIEGIMLDLEADNSLSIGRIMSRLKMGSVNSSIEAALKFHLNGLFKSKRVHEILKWKYPKSLDRNIPHPIFNSYHIIIDGIAYNPIIGFNFGSIFEDLYEALAYGHISIGELHEKALAEKVPLYTVAGQLRSADYWNGDFSMFNLKGIKNLAYLAWTRQWYDHVVARNAIETLGFNSLNLKRLAGKIIVDSIDRTLKENNISNYSISSVHLDQLISGKTKKFDWNKLFILKGKSGPLSKELISRLTLKHTIGSVNRAIASEISAVTKVSERVSAETATRISQLSERLKHIVRSRRDQINELEGFDSVLSFLERVVEDALAKQSSLMEAVNFDVSTPLDRIAGLAERELSPPPTRHCVSSARTSLTPTSTSKTAKQKVGGKSVVRAIARPVVKQNVKPGAGKVIRPQVKLAKEANALPIHKVEMAHEMMMPRVVYDEKSVAILTDEKTTEDVLENPVVKVVSSVTPKMSETQQESRKSSLRTVPSPISPEALHNSSRVSLAALDNPSVEIPRKKEPKLASLKKMGLSLYLLEQIPEEYSEPGARWRASRRPAIPARRSPRYADLDDELGVENISPTQDTKSGGVRSKKRDIVGTPLAPLKDHNGLSLRMILSQ